MSYSGDDTHSANARRSSSASCKPLLDVATPELFRTNAFRITGLRVDATTREIAKHADKLKMMEELGQGKSVHTGAFSLKTPPSVDQIREAIQRLKEPEQRIIDEFFWFWPRQFGQSASDPAIIALEAGDADTAIEIWESLETHPSEGVVAIHNIAVLWHCMALEWERHYAKAVEFTKEQRAEVNTLWRGSFKRWEILAVDDLFWAKVSARIKELDDPRLTTGFARRMRATLPQALDKINAELAVRYAESGNMVSARVHVAFMRESNTGLDNIEATVELVLAPATARIKQQIQIAESKAKNNPMDAGKAAADLLKYAQSACVLFDLLLGATHTVRQSLFDQVAEVCAAMLVTYRKESDDSVWCLEIGIGLLPLVSDTDLHLRCEENIRAWRSMVARKVMEPLFVVLHAVRDSEISPHLRLRRFDRELSPILSKSPTLVKLGRVGAAEFYNEAALVLRDISLDAWNKHQDKSTALSAIEKAIKTAVTAEILDVLRKDIEKIRVLPGTVKRAATKAWSDLKDALLKVFGYAVALGVFALFAHIMNSCSSKKGGASVNSATPSTYVPPKPAKALGSVPYAGIGTEKATSTPLSVVQKAPPKPSTYTPLEFGSDGKLIYSVPKSRTAELDLDRAALDTQKRISAQFTKQIDILGREIDAERAALNRTSKFAVEQFNRKLDSYNSLIEQAKAQDQIVNRLVNDYNAKLRRYGR